MKISIVLSTYNGETYITEQLNSILNQTRKADEVLIFDDCSTDNTPQVIEQFILEHNLITWKFVVNRENKGWKRNFMEGIWSAVGDLVFPCDQDDIWMPHKLEVMEKIMNDNPHIMVLTSGYRSLYDSGDEIDGPVILDGKLVKQQLTEKIFSIKYPGCTYCIRKHLVEFSKKHWQKNFPHDALFWRMAMFSDSLYSYNVSLIYWRKHSDSTFSKESVSNRTFTKKRESLNYARSVTEDLEIFLNEFDCARKEEKLIVLAKVRKWIGIREKFYDSKNPFYGIKLLKYINCYDRIRQYYGDWYLIYGKKN